MVSSIQTVIPIIVAFRVPMQDHHWAAISEILKEEIKLTDEFALGNLMKMNVVEKQEEIIAVATQASQETELRDQLKIVKDKWEDKDLPIQRFKDKDTWILGDTEELLSILDDSLARVSIIAGNRYVAPLRDEVNNLKNNLNTMQDVLEEWAMLQKSWMHLEALFSSQDIKRKLASETQMFNSVDKFYRNFMKKVNLNSNCLQVCVYEGRMLDYFKKHNSHLESIQRNLTQYLEEKRMLFPRFYFISDEELLQILTQASNPQLIQNQIKKCFENINKLDFADDNSSIDVIGMVSAENEHVSFGGRVLKARGNPEEWLNSVQNTMIDTLVRAVKGCKEDTEKKEKKEWVMLDHPVQATSLVSQMAWCAETEYNINMIGDVPNSMAI